jgi:hypothetical protein
MTRRLSATATQLAWYIERDGYTVRAVESGQYVAARWGATYFVPASDVANLNAERDRVYAILADKRRKAAAR